MRRLAYISFSGAVLAVAVVAQPVDGGPVSGKVIRGPDREAVIGALVHFTRVRRPKEEQPPAYTDKDGNFVRSLPQGKIVATAKKQDVDGTNWASEAITVTVASVLGATVPDLVLNPEKAASVYPEGNGAVRARSQALDNLVLVLYRLPPMAPDLQTSEQTASPAAAVTGCPPNNACINGNITSEHGPIAATIVISDAASGGDLKPVEASGDGSFTLVLPLGRTFLLTVISEGYQARVLVARVPSSASAAIYDLAGDRVDASNLNLDTESNSESAADPSSGEPALNLETRTFSRYYVFDSPVIEKLPFAGIWRADDLALLLPGVAPPPQTYGHSGPSISPTVGSAGQFAMNGLRARENNFTVDGADNNDEDIGVRRQGYVSPLAQSVESIAEFQVITALPDAQFGWAAGGQVNVLSKTGSSGFHGEIYGFGTGTALMARDFFNMGRNSYPQALRDRIPVTSDGTLGGKPVWLDLGSLNPTGLQSVNGLGYADNPLNGKDPYTRLQTGGAVGGSIIPGRTFFFASYESQIVHATRQTNFAVPTVAQRGIFGTGATGFTAEGQPIFPASLAGNGVFSLYPLPNNPLGPYGGNTFSENLAADATGRLYSLKVDHSLSGGRHRLTARYNATDEDSDLPATGGALFASIQPRIRTQNVATFFTSSFGSASNTVRASFGRTSAQFDPVPDRWLSAPSLYPGYTFLLNAPLLLNVTRDGSGQAHLVSASSALGQKYLRGADLPPDTLTADAINGPLGEVMMGGFSSLGVDVFRFPQTRVNDTFQIADTFNHFGRTHHWTGGADLRKVELNNSVERNVRPLAVYSGAIRVPESNFEGPSCGLLTGCPTISPTPPSDIFDAASMAAAGQPTAFFQTFAEASSLADGSMRIHLNEINLFLQDEIRLRSNVQLTLGVRVQTSGAPSDVDARLRNAFDPTALTSAIQSVAGQGGCGPNCEAVLGSLQAGLPASFGDTFDAHRFGADGRMGFVWSPGESKIVVRGGFGTYSGQFPGIIVSESQSVFPSFLPFDLSAANELAFNTPFGSGGLYPKLQPGSLSVLQSGPNPTADAVSLLALTLSALNPTLAITQPAARLQNPVAYQYSFMLERAMGRGFTANLAYVGTQGRHLLRVDTPDGGPLRSSIQYQGIAQYAAASPFAAPNITPYLPGAVPTLAAPAPAPPAVVRTLFESTANSGYNALQAQLQRRLGGSVLGSAAFTYSHAIDDVSDFFDMAGAYALPQDSRNRSEKGSANFDTRLRFVSQFTWDIFPKRTNRFLRGWSLAGIFTAQTGQPFTVNTTVDTNLDGNLTDRIDPGNNLLYNPIPGNQRVMLALAPGTTKADLLAPVGQDGTLGRNTYNGAGINDLDLALIRSFNWRASRRLELRTESFNAMNRANFALPDRILESPAFGQAVTTSVPPRSFQFSLKVQF